MDDLLEQRGNVLIVVIERIAADVAGVDDAAHADFIERTFVQKLQKGFFDRVSGVVMRHGTSSFCKIPSYSYYIIFLKKRKSEKFYPVDARKTMQKF